MQPAPRGSCPYEKLTHRLQLLEKSLVESDPQVAEIMVCLDVKSPMGWAAY